MSCNVLPQDPNYKRDFDHCKAMHGHCSLEEKSHDNKRLSGCILHIGSGGLALRKRWKEAGQLAGYHEMGFISFSTFIPKAA
ncbi:hypothetical protein ACLOJK_033819 [Asimina triloba]